MWSLARREVWTDNAKPWTGQRGRPGGWEDCLVFRPLLWQQRGGSRRGHAIAGVQAKAIGVDGCEDSRNAGGMNPRAARKVEPWLTGEKSTEPPGALQIAPDIPHPSHPHLVHCTIFKHVPKHFSLAGFLIFLCLLKKGAGGGCGGGLPCLTPSLGCKVAVTTSRIWSFQFKDKFQGRRGQEACKWPPAQQAPGPAPSEVPGLPASEASAGRAGAQLRTDASSAPSLPRPHLSSSPGPGWRRRTRRPAAGPRFRLRVSLPPSFGAGPRVKALFLGFPGSRTAPGGQPSPRPAGREGCACGGRGP
uniref:Uncharacterized protein n=1 Tax=Myotis myotis TaxID=51298 RepID=A0A7J7Z576_MYOMY|nr:hypothetical protein mMyoMyo1_010751 [Myotis myotis]